MRKFLYKSLFNSAWLCSRQRLAINNKTEIFLVNRPQLAENVILVFGFGSQERTNRG